jgi:hypothetical protein
VTERERILRFIRAAATYWRQEAKLAGRRTDRAYFCEGKAGVLDALAIDIENNQHLRSKS